MENFRLISVSCLLFICGVWVRGWVVHTCLSMCACVCVIITIIPALVTFNNYYVTYDFADISKPYSSSLLLL